MVMDFRSCSWKKERCGTKVKVWSRIPHKACLLRDTHLNFTDIKSTSLVLRKLLMAPSRKSGVNKRLNYANEVANNTYGENVIKGKQKKKRFSDMLGPQWNKEELERFYQAYRKYGRDWKKVAAVVGNRSFEMVESLYTMNRAYLSLPEGTASVVGLVAMMTDHYCVLGGSDSEQESYEVLGALQKPQKRARGKLKNKVSKISGGTVDDVTLTQSIPSTDGCLSLLRKRRSDFSVLKPHAVGKRTPRVLVSYLRDKERETYFSPARLGVKLKAPPDRDKDVTHKIALALTEASQRDGSSQLSQTSNQKSEVPVLSPFQSGVRMRSESEMTSAKLRCSEMDEGGCELSFRSTGGDYERRKKSYTVRTDHAVAVEVRKKGNRYNVKKQKEEENKYNHLDDIKEACSGTEGQKLDSVRGNFEEDDMDVKISRSSSKVPRKRSKKVLADDESAFDALQTLADLSLMMLETTVDTESSAMVKEEHLNTMKKSKIKGSHSAAGAETAAFKRDKIGKDFDHGVDAIPVPKEGLDQSRSTQKQKLKPSPSKAKDLVKTSIGKGKRSSHTTGSAQDGRWVNNSEHAYLNTGLAKEENAALISSESLINLTTKIGRKRKMDFPKPHSQKNSNVSENIAFDVHERVIAVEERLSHCLSSDQLRRWCTFEWLYSAFDHPWFAKCEFVEYLNHVGLGHVPRLTRVEWGVIQSSLGRPRRFSVQFLKEEKQKLIQYRESVRKHYAELLSGTKGLPTDLAKPLYVGQHVIAVHPSSREMHDGSILTVDYNRCRVQFDMPKLGVEFVTDINCMPSIPFENMPASLTRHNLSLDKILGIGNLIDHKIIVQQKEGKIDDQMKFFSIEELGSSDDPVLISPSPHNVSILLKQKKEEICYSSSQAKSRSGEMCNSQHDTNPQYSVSEQLQTKEADIQALSELTRSLDKKDALVSELKRMNGEVLENQKNGDSLLKDSEHFKKQYAAVLHLNEVNEERNTYQGATAMSLKPLSDSTDPSFLDQEPPGSHVGDLFGISRTNARAMVDAAIKAVSTMRRGEDSFESVEDAIDFVNNRLSENDSALPAMKSNAAVSNQANLTSQNNSMNPSNSLATSHVDDPKSNGSYDLSDAQMSSELIAHCVSALLVIQKCTERQFLPSDVAQVLDSAATTLQPRCSENLPIYAEIQKCMGIIRSQILALIPT